MTPTACPGVPFPLSCALNTDRLQPPLESGRQRITLQKEDKTGNITYVPGNPAVGLLEHDVRAYLRHGLETPTIDDLYDHLWFVAKPFGHSIDALNVQRVMGRRIIASDDPELHLVWDRNGIYIKPVPEFFLSYDFWALYLSGPQRSDAPTGGAPPRATVQREGAQSDREIALGFLRSYALLVASPLDFRLAQEAHLLPDGVDWLRWAAFIRHFRGIGDEQVARRYHYGQMRLSRLNWAVRLFRPRRSRTAWFYVLPHWSIRDFVARTTVVLIFLFAMLSLALSAMQVALAVPAQELWSTRPGALGLQEMSRVFWVFAVAVIVLLALFAVLLAGIPCSAWLWQLLWGYRHRLVRSGLRGKTV